MFQFCRYQITFNMIMTTLQLQGPDALPISLMNGKRVVRSLRVFFLTIKKPQKPKKNLDSCRIRYWNLPTLKSVRKISTTTQVYLSTKYLQHFSGISPLKLTVCSMFPNVEHNLIPQLAWKNLDDLVLFLWRKRCLQQSSDCVLVCHQEIWQRGLASPKERSLLCLTHGLNF